MIASFRSCQSKMTAQHVRNALAFAVFSFLLVLIATFGVVYRYDLYPSAGYGALVHIGLYHSPNISTTVISEMSTAKTVRGPEITKTPPATAGHEDTKEDSSNPDDDFFNKIISVFASGSPRLSDTLDQTQPTGELPSGTRSRVKFIDDAQRVTHNLNKFSNKKQSEPYSDDDSKSTRGNPEKIHDIPKQSTGQPNHGPSFYDRLFNIISKDVAGSNKPDTNRNEQKRNYEYKIPSSARRGETRVYPLRIEEILENPPNAKFDPRTISTALSGLENFFEELGGDISSSESFELPEFPFIDLFDGDDDGTSPEVTQESDSEERDFPSFGRNTMHFAQPERLPRFPHPVVDFPLNRNFHA